MSRNKYGSIIINLGDVDISDLGLGDITNIDATPQQQEQINGIFNGTLITKNISCIVHDIVGDIDYSIPFVLKGVVFGDNLVIFRTLVPPYTDSVNYLYVECYVDTGIIRVGKTDL